jgi:zinc transport system permease protein
MVLTIGVAYAVVYRAGVPAKDTLAILWGNIFALTYVDMAVTGGFCLVSFVFVATFFQQLKAMLFDSEIAFTSGVNEALLQRAVLILIGVTVAFSLKLVGALLLDSLLLLPAIVATFFARSVRSLFVLAGVFGLAASLGGFLLALQVDIPASSAVTIVAALLFAAGLVFRRTKGGIRT